MKDGLRVIDADAHFYEPVDIWDKYVEPAYYDRRPIVTGRLGNSILSYESTPQHTAFNSQALWSLMEEKFGDSWREGWTLESRLRDMDREGWDVQVCLPTSGGRGIGDKDIGFASAMARAYNNWAHDFCSGAPGRLKYTAQVPKNDITAMVTETRRAVDGLGAVSVMLPQADPEKMWHHADYDVMWAAVQDLDVPLSVHGEGCSSGQPLVNARYHGGHHFFVAMEEAMGFPFENMTSLAHFIYSGLLDRYPQLRLLLLESKAGWVPFWLDRLEEYGHGRKAVFFDSQRPQLTSQEYFLRQCAVAADADEPSVKYVVDYLGDDSIVFNTDYPHPDALGAAEPLKRMMAQPIPDDSKRKILWDNSVKAYGKRVVEGSPLA